MVSVFRELKHSHYVGKLISFPYITLPPKHKDSSQIIYTLMWFLVFTFKPRVCLKKKGGKSETKEQKIRELTGFFFFFLRKWKRQKVKKNFFSLMHQMKDGGRQMQDALYQEKKVDKIYENQNYEKWKTRKTWDSIIKSTNMQEKYCFICQSLGEKVEKGKFWAGHCHFLHLITVYSECSTCQPCPRPSMLGRINTNSTS